MTIEQSATNPEGAPTVLLVDDDASFREVVRTALEGRGYRVVQANNARRATAMLERVPPDLVVVDGLLPDETGVHWIESLRSQGRALDVVFVSAFWRDLGSFRHLTSDLGVRLVAQKPISIDRFVEQIGRLLPSPQGPPPARHTVEVEGALLSLSRRFARSLPVRVHEIARLCERLADLTIPLDLLARATTLTHRLAGTGGTYGFEAVSQSALALEAALRALAIAGPYRDVQSALADLTAAARIATPERRELPRSPLFPRALLVGATTLSEAALAACQDRLIALDSTGYAAALPRLLQRPPAVAALCVGPQTHARALALGVVLRQRGRGRRTQIAYLVPPGDEALQREAARQPGVTVVPDTIEPAQLARLLEALALRASAPAGRVLLVARDVACASRQRALLEETGLEVVVAKDAARTLEHLALEAPDLLLLDLDLPAGELAVLVQRVRSRPTWQGMPIVVLGQHADPAFEARVYAAGADDVVPGQLTPARVLTRIARRIDHLRLTQAHGGLDALTHLPARGRFLDGLSTLLAEGQRRLRPTVVTLLDIDGLGAWNTRHGRSAGDQLLLTLARLLESRLRAEDLRARLGQGTFALAFSECEVGAIQAVVQGVLAGFSSSGAAPTFSAGLAVVPDDAEDLQAVICRAFERMVEAKVSGRDRVVGGGES